MSHCCDHLDVVDISSSVTIVISLYFALPSFSKAIQLQFLLALLLLIFSFIPCHKPGQAFSIAPVCLSVVPSVCNFVRNGLIGDHLCPLLHLFTVDIYLNLFDYTVCAATVYSVLFCPR